MRIQSLSDYMKIFPILNRVVKFAESPLQSSQVCECSKLVTKWSSCWQALEKRSHYEWLICLWLITSTILLSGNLSYQFIQVTFKFEFSLTKEIFLLFTFRKLYYKNKGFILIVFLLCIWDHIRILYIRFVSYTFSCFI